jgi:disulfide bond formation protein DsbB
MKRAVLAGAALLSLAAVGAALYSQHVWDMQPCPWCVLQRLVFVCIAAACLAGLALPRTGATLALALAVSGVAAALWQHFVATSAESCDLTLADRILAATGLDGAYPEVFMAMASCADAKVSLMGVPYEAYSGVLFLAIAAAMAWVVGKRRR